MKQSLWAGIKAAVPKSTCLYIVLIKHEVWSVKTGKNHAEVNSECLLLLSESYGCYRIMGMERLDW